MLLIHSVNAQSQQKELMYMSNVVLSVKLQGGQFGPLSYLPSLSELLSPSNVLTQHV